MEIHGRLPLNSGIRHGNQTCRAHGAVDTPSAGVYQSRATGRIALSANGAAAMALGIDMENIHAGIKFRRLIKSFRIGGSRSHWQAWAESSASTETMGAQGRCAGEPDEEEGF